MIRKILRLPQVEDATGESRSTIYKRISEGEFPKPVKLGTKSVGWPKTRSRPTSTAASPRVTPLMADPLFLVVQLDGNFFFWLLIGGGAE